MLSETRRCLICALLLVHTLQVGAAGGREMQWSGVGAGGGVFGGCNFEFHTHVLAVVAHVLSCPTSKTPTLSWYCRLVGNHGDVNRRQRCLCKQIMHARTPPLPPRSPPHSLVVCLPASGIPLAPHPTSSSFSPLLQPPNINHTFIPLKPQPASRILVPMTAASASASQTQHFMYT